jgi:hypothetical protein
MNLGPPHALIVLEVGVLTFELRHNCSANALLTKRPLQSTLIEHGDKYRTRKRDALVYHQLSRIQFGY